MEKCPWDRANPPRLRNRGGNKEKREALATLYSVLGHFLTQSYSQSKPSYRAASSVVVVSATEERRQALG